MEGFFSNLLAVSFMDSPKVFLQHSSSGIFLFPPHFLHPLTVGLSVFFRPLFVGASLFTSARFRHFSSGFLRISLTQVRLA